MRACACAQEGEEAEEDYEGGAEGEGDEEVREDSLQRRRRAFQETPRGQSGGRSQLWSL